MSLSPSRRAPPAQLGPGPPGSQDFTEQRGPQYLNAETGLRASAYRFGERVLIVCDEREAGVVLLATLEEQAEAEWETEQ